MTPWRRDIQQASKRGEMLTAADDGDVPYDRGDFSPTPVSETEEAAQAFEKAEDDCLIILWHRLKPLHGFLDFCG